MPPTAPVPQPRRPAPTGRRGRGGDAASPRAERTENAMAALLGLGLSILITAALLGWLDAAAE
ncbi:hypothetical protein D3273_18385 [Lichenibacterium minor]|uniref:Uncharacterized protein n=1 Tax=Lichenibacterium minor TaxID=2316528 RepID=A0A4Q2U6L7_9HYPH|nr:hypothetical protein [Lichenibacterium minor]RYC30505.1 hypothetical protein D3273_18385 [Lichenibacterium minor]